MFRLIIKILLTSVVVVAVSEFTKRSVWLGAVLAALPVTSLLALSWPWIDTRDVEKVAGLSMWVFWAVIPSLAFFPLFAWLMRLGWSFGLSLALASLATAASFICVSRASNSSGYPITIRFEGA